MTHILNARMTYHRIPVHRLEKFIIKDPIKAYQKFQESGLDECVLVQTCNRIELYGRATDTDYTAITKAWAELTGLDAEEFREMITGEDAKAIEHLLMLASGLDSMVLGEEQVLGQVKDAITQARDAGASGLYLNKLFDSATRIGTRVRNNTGIGHTGVSVGSMAVKLAEEHVDHMKSKRLLVIGTGEVSTLVAKSLLRREYNFDVTSRTLRRAAAFCDTVGGTPVRFEDVLGDFRRYDVMFVATTAPYFLVAYDAVKASQDNTRGSMILDLSNPRAVDERIANIPGIKLMNLDQIGEMVERNLKDRSRKAQTIRNAITDEVPALEASMHRLEAEPLISHIFQGMDRIRERELAKALRMLGEKDPRHVQIMTDMSRAILENMIAEPTGAIRLASEHNDKELVNAAARLFNYKHG